MSKKRCAVEKVIIILRYFHLVGLAEAKENPQVRLDRTRRCSIWCVSVNFCGFLLFFFFSSFGNPAKEHYGRYPETAISVNTFIIGFTVFFHLIVCLFVFRVTHSHSWCAFFTSFGNRWHWQENNVIQKWKTRGKISAGSFITRLYSATAPTDSIYGKKNSLRCKGNNPVRLHILLVTLHAPASCENKFFQSILCTVMQEVAITILSPYR